MLRVRKIPRLKKTIERSFCDRISPKKTIPRMNSNTLNVPIYNPNQKKSPIRMKGSLFRKAFRVKEFLMESILGDNNKDKVLMSLF